MGFGNLQRSWTIYTLWKSWAFVKNSTMTNISTNKYWFTCLIIYLVSFPRSDIIIIMLLSICAMAKKKMQKILQIKNISNTLKFSHLNYSLGLASILREPLKILSKEKFYGTSLFYLPVIIIVIWEIHNVTKGLWKSRWRITWFLPRKGGGGAEERWVIGVGGSKGRSTGRRV